MTRDELTHDDLGLGVRGTLARLEAEVRFRGWESAARAGRWDRAFSRVRGLADLFAKDAPSSCWTRLLLTALDAAARSNARGDTGRFVRTVAPWADRLSPGAMAAVFATCTSYGNEALAEEIGAALVRAWPDEPVGYFARADAAERRAYNRGWRPRAEWASDFGDAHERCGNLAESWQRHVAMRWVVAHLRSGGARATIRPALKSLRAAELDTGESVWFAHGLAHSDHWLDIVRAADLVDGALDDLEAAGSEHLPAATRGGLAALFECLGPELHPTVAERLDALLSHPILPGEDVARWRRSLEMRDQLAPQLDTPLTEASDLIGSAAVMHRALTGGPIEATGIVGKTAQVVRDPTADAIDALRRELVKQSPMAWRPIAAAWPRLLAREGVVDPLDRLGRAWCERAPRPSYGWWLLAWHFHAAGCHEAAEAAAWRGWRETPDDDGGARDIVIGHVLNRVVRSADLRTLRRWLEAGEALANR